MEPNPGTPDAAGDREPGLEPGCESDAGEMPGILDEESLFTHAPIGTAHSSAPSPAVCRPMAQRVGPGRRRAAGGA